MNECKFLKESERTSKTYSFLWSRHDETLPVRWHFNLMQDVIPEDIVRGNLGLEVGCGCGYDTFIMAKNNPSVKIIGIDVSEEGVSKAYRFNNNLKNSFILRASAMNIPLGNNKCDFVYSFGVLHHIREYKKSFLEIYRVLKPKSPIFIYLYEDFSGSFLKRNLIKVVSIIRKITVKLSPSVIYKLTYLFAPFLFLFFSCPAKIFKKFKFTYRWYEKTPFNYGTGLFSLRDDLYDRFAAPIENRFNKKMLHEALNDCEFKHIKVTRLKAISGLVAWAYKEDSNP